MIPKDRKCCDMGTYECQVPMPLNGRVQGIDYCIADIVAALNAANLTTVASCCGHGVTKSVISLEDGRELHIKNVKKVKMEQTAYDLAMIMCGSCKYTMPNQLTSHLPIDCYIPECAKGKNVLKVLRKGNCNAYSKDEDK